MAVAGVEIVIRFFWQAGSNSVPEQVSCSRLGASFLPSKPAGGVAWHRCYGSDEEDGRLARRRHLAHGQPETQFPTGVVVDDAASRGRWRQATSTRGGHGSAG